MVEISLALVFIVLTLNLFFLTITCNVVFAHIYDTVSSTSSLFAISLSQVLIFPDLIANFSSSSMLNYTIICLSQTAATDNGINSTIY